MNTTSVQYKSRWGYHACEYALFLKLKQLHKWYWKSVYDFHRWHRWQRKHPQNRVGPEPSVCEAFVEEQPWYKPVTVHGEPGFKLYPKTLVDQNVVALYQSLRCPSRASVPSLDGDTREKIESLHAEVMKTFAE